MLDNNKRNTKRFSAKFFAAFILIYLSTVQLSFGDSSEPTFGITFVQTQQSYLDTLNLTEQGRLLRSTILDRMKQPLVGGHTDTSDLVKQYIPDGMQTYKAEAILKAAEFEIYKKGSDLTAFFKIPTGMFTVVMVYVFVTESESVTTNVVSFIDYTSL